MEALAGRRAHFTHLQFHCYGGGGGEPWSSAAAKVIEYVNAHPEVSVDVGQVMFGPAMTITADAPVEYLLHKSSGRRWTNIDIELETGCGIVPLTYKDKAAVSALQWAVGLELFLLSADPWRVVLSTDHPNGGSFLSYPALIQLLMDRSVRDEQLKRVNPKLLAGSALADGIAREYTLNEIAIITRAGPARLLGLPHKGHLGAGRRRRRDDLQPRSRPRDDVLDAALRHQGWRADRRGGPAPARAGRPTAATWRRDTTTRCWRTCVGTSTPIPRCRSTTIPCRRCRASRWRWDENGDEHPRRLHRGDLRRGVHHARGAGHHHGPKPALGARGGAQAHRLRHLGHRLQVRGGDRARAGRGGDARRPSRRQHPVHDR